MKKILIVSLVLVSLVLVAVFTVPIFAHGPEDGEPADQDAWGAMHEACESGDWEAMAEAAEEVHGDDFDYSSCGGDGYYAPGEDASSATRWGGMGGHMGGSGWGGMMSW